MIPDQIAGSIGFWALLVHLPQMARGSMALSPAATGLLLTALTVPMFLLPSVGAKLAAKLPARWYFAGGLGIVGGADLLLALAARDLSARWPFGPLLAHYLSAALAARCSTHKSRLRPSQLCRPIARRRHRQSA
jgi:hypothetical protein